MASWPCLILCAVLVTHDCLTGPWRSLPTTVNGPGTGSYTWDYHWDFCQNVPVDSTCDTFTGNTAAYRLEQYPGSFPQCHNMGPDVLSAPVAVTKLNGDAEQGLTIQFTAPVTYSLTVNVRCDETARGVDTSPTAPAVFATTMTIDWDTFETCPAAPGHPFNSGLSFGWVFIIVVCVGGVLYVGGGYAYNSQKNGLSGKDALPHQSFWQNVVQEGPELVADGVWFTRHTLATNVSFLAFLDPPPRKGQDPEDPFTDALEREKNSLVAPAGDGSGRKKKKKKKSSKDSKSRKSKSGSGSGGGGGDDEPTEGVVATNFNPNYGPDGEIIRG
jgi:hypothetical protein